MELPTSKCCSSCRIDKPLEEFYRAASTTDGHQARCKDCHLESARAYRRRLQEHNAANPPDPDRLKRCPACEQVKEGRQFHRNRSSRDGRHWTCKACNGGGRYSPEAEQRRRFRRYRITPEEVEALLLEQAGSCAICHTPFEGTAFNIDHCHATGRVRGLLCGQCNTGLGLLGDDDDRLRAAIGYLQHPPIDAIRTS